MDRRATEINISVMKAEFEKHGGRHSAMHDEDARVYRCRARWQWVSVSVVIHIVVQMYVYTYACMHARMHRDATEPERIPVFMCTRCAELSLEEAGKRRGNRWRGGQTRLTD
eukprot:GHVU01024430.1.p3 GENE.GHVU01024430.1~~GHVU01024430.1.p3  ORF type:complete len:112 (+),score=3.59 GHVU01024430.1:96-431(+)